MITDAILNMVHTSVGALLALLPDMSIDWGSTGLGTLAAFANAVLPVSEMFSVMRILVTLTSGGVLVWAVVKLIDWLPFT